jgi:aminomethyltransferase
MPELKHSPLEGAHQILGARLVPFAGWNMPVQYASIIAEHTAIRTKVGIFDISHMGQFFVSGPAAEAWLNRMLTNNIAKLVPGQGQYTLMLNENGGVIDDLIAYRTGPNDYFLMVNASMIEEDYCWLAGHQDKQVTLRNESDLWAGMAVQGPLAAEIFATVYPGQTLPPRNGIATTAAGAIVCRTGYTGEDGFEVMLPAGRAAQLWIDLKAAGVAEAGLGARDTLRLEAGMNLYGNDMDETISPLDAGLSWTVDLKTPREFVGRPALEQQLANAGARKALVGLKLLDKGVLRSHQKVATPLGDGEITSGTFSPTLGFSVAMARVPRGVKPGDTVQVDIRGKLLAAQVVKVPFVRNGKALM